MKNSQPWYTWEIVCLNELLQRLSPAQPWLWSACSRRRNHQYSFFFTINTPCRQHGGNMWNKTLTWNGLTCILHPSQYCISWTSKKSAKCNGSSLLLSKLFLSWNMQSVAMLWLLLLDQIMHFTFNVKIGIQLPAVLRQEYSQLVIIRFLALYNLDSTPPTGSTVSTLVGWVHSTLNIWMKFCILRYILSQITKIKMKSLGRNVPFSQYNPLRPVGCGYTWRIAALLCW